ncbi:MAG: helix-turn-helix domain-containing protein [Solirubrobacteraceae bacterium]
MNSAHLSRASFGAAVYALREERRLSEGALASAAQLPSPNLVESIEQGRLAVRLTTVLGLAEALGVSAAELLRRAERIDG